MSTGYIWLGGSDDWDDANSKPKGIDDDDYDKSMIWPLLWFAGDAPPSFKTKPAFLVHAANTPLRSMFELFGCEIHKDNSWFIAVLEATEKEIQLDGVAAVDDGKITTFTKALDIAAVENTGELTFLESVERTWALKKVDNGELESFSVSFKISGKIKTEEIKSLELDEALLVEIDWENSELGLKINGGATQIFPDGLFGQSANLGLRKITGKEDKELFIDVPCSSTQTSSYRPIPGTGIEVTFELIAMKFRLARSGVALFPGAPNVDELFSAKLKLPLIEARVDDADVAGISKILPLRKDGKTVQFGFTLTVSFGFPDRVAPNLPSDPDWRLVNAPILELENAGSELRKPDWNLRALSVFAAKIKKISVGDGLDLSSLAGPLGALAGGKGGDAKFSICDANKLLANGQDLVNKVTDVWVASKRLPVPVGFKVELGGERGTLSFLATFYLDLWAGRLTDNRAYFICKPELEAQDTPMQWLDFKQFAFSLPNDLDVELNQASEYVHDGYIDFKQREVVIDFQREDGAPIAPQVTIPGELTRDASGEVPKEELNKRFRLQMDSFDPENWDTETASPEKRLTLRIGERGLSLAARAFPGKEATTIDQGIEPPIKASLVDRGKGAGRMVIVDSRVVYGALSGTLEVPGLKDMEMDLDVTVRQDGAKPLRIDTRVSLRKESAIARLNLGFAKVRIEEIAANLTWVEKKGWGAAALLSGDAWLTEESAAPGGLDSLKKPGAFRFDDVDLLELHKQDATITLKPTPDKPGRQYVIDFELLHGQFAVRSRGLTIDWKGSDKRGVVTMDRAEFEYRNPGQLDVMIEAGSLGIEIDLSPMSVKLNMPSYLGIDAVLSSGVRFRGLVGWYDDPVENYMAARGTVSVPGFPETTAALKLGVGYKADGTRAPNIVLFGEQETDLDLFAGAVAKKIGVGIGLNNRPAGFSAEPDPDQILAELPRLDVADPFSWRFVREPGVYVIILMRTLIGSNRGAKQAHNLYLLEMLLSLDSNLNAIAAGKLWLFSSPAFIDRAANRGRSVAIAAAVMRLRRQTLALVAETRPKPAMEKGGQLAKLFDTLSIRLSSYLSPDMADFYLERISYRENLLGMDCLVAGQYRLVASRYGLLNRSSLLFRGQFDKEFNLGIGGFRARGLVLLAGEFAGMITENGLASYAVVDVRVDLYIRAYLYLPDIRMVSKTIRIVIPPIVIVYWVLRCRRWRCSMKRREKTLVPPTVIKTKIKVPVVTIEKKYAPEISLNVDISGGLGFNEAGSIGFRGSIGVSVSVLGRRKRLSASMCYQPGVVDEVRGRVAAIESRIDKVRGLKAPPPRLSEQTSDEGPNSSGEEWIYLRRRHRGTYYHLLIPAPGSTWFVPSHHGALDQYANLPREWPTWDGSSSGEEIATDTEMGEMSPLRQAVTRIRVSFQEEGKEREVELAMPWDRYNLDALAGDLTEEDMLDVVERFSRIEALMLHGASDPGTADTNDEILRREAATELVIDPRWQSSSRLFLRERTSSLPADVRSADFRPLDEVLSSATGVAGLGDVDLVERLRLFARLRGMAVRAGLHEAEDLDEPNRLRDARANALALMARDLDLPDGPELFGALQGVQLETPESDLSDGVISLPKRRHFPLLLKAGTTVALNAVVLQNLTNLDELISAIFDPDETDTIEISLNAELFWTDDNKKPVESSLTSPKQKQLKVPRDDQELAELNVDVLIAISVAEFSNPPEAFKDNDRINFALTILSRIWKRDENGERVVDGDGNPVEDKRLKAFSELKFEGRFVADPEQIERSVGLVFTTDADVDLQQLWEKNECTIRVHRQAKGNMIRAGDDEVTQLSLREQHPLRIRERMFALESRQQILEPGREGGEDGPVQQTLRILLPIDLHERFIAEDLPRISHFSVHRVVDDGSPEVVSEHVQLGLTEVSDRGRNYLLFNGVLATDTLWVESGEKQSFYGTVRGGDGTLSRGELLAAPGRRPTIRYFVTAVPYGEETRGEENEQRQSLIWPSIRPFFPAPEIELPSVALVIEGADLANGKELRVRAVPLAALANPEADTKLPEKRTLELFAERLPMAMGRFYGDAADARDAGIDPGLRLSELESDAPPLTVVKAEQIPLKFDPSAMELKVENLKTGYTYALYGRFKGPRGEVNERLSPIPVHLVQSLPAVGAVPPGRTLPSLELIAKLDWERSLRAANTLQEDDWLSSKAFTARRRELAGVRGIAFGCDVLTSMTESSDGGLEVVVQDAHESNLVYRVLSEVVDESSFRGEITTLDQRDHWTIPLRSVRDKLPVWSEIDAEEVETLIPYYLYSATQNPLLNSFWDARNRLADINLLAVDENEVISKNAEPNWKNWVKLHGALTEWFAAVDDLQASPLAVGGPEVGSEVGPEVGPEVAKLTITTNIERMRLLCRHLLLGLKPPKDDLESLSTKDLQKNLDKLSTLIDKIRAIDIRDGQSSGEREEFTRAARLSHLYDIGRRATGLLMRRLALVEELFDPPEQGLETVPLGSHLRNWENDVIPGHVHWKDNLAPELPELPELPEVEAASPDKAREQSQVLFDLLQKLRGLIAEKEDVYQKLSVGLSETIVDFCETHGLDKSLGEIKEGPIGRRAAESLPQSAALTALINSLSLDLASRGMRLIRRPHHQLAAGDAKNVVSLTSLIATSVDTRLDKVLFSHEAAESGARHTSLHRTGVIAILNLFERLGFALDLAAADELGQLVPQELLIDLVREVRWDLDKVLGVDHRLFLVVVREPDHDLSPAASIGPSFLKLVVLPEALIGCLIAENPIKIKNSAGAEVEKQRDQLLEPWLKVRGITVDARSADLIHARFSTIVKAFLGASVKDPTAPPLLILEEREGAFKLRPERAGRIHGFWPFDGEEGHRFHVSVRRISRYEPLVRWLNRLPSHRERINGESAPWRREVVFKPKRLPDAAKLSGTALTLVQHPDQPGFSFRLPPVGERAMLSSLSRVRTGFDCVDIALYHQFIHRAWFEERIANLNTSPDWVVPGEGIDISDDGRSVSFPAVGGTNQYRYYRRNDGFLALLEFADNELRVGIPTFDTLGDNDPATFTFKEKIESSQELSRVQFVPWDSGLPESSSLRARIEIVEDSEIGVSVGATGGFQVRACSRAGILSSDQITAFPLLVHLGDDLYARRVDEYDPNTGILTFDKEIQDLDSITEVYLYLGEPPLQTHPLTTGSPPNPWLFRFEQLLLPDGLPYHHKYGAQIEFRYAAESDEEFAPDKKEVAGPIFRSPGRLGGRAPLVRWDEEKIMVTLFLSRLEDHLSPAERRSYRQFMPKNRSVGKWEDIQLPDPELRYSLYWQTRGTEDRSPGEEPFYRPVVEVQPILQGEIVEKVGLRWFNRQTQEPEDVNVHHWQVRQDATDPIYVINLEIDVDQDGLTSWILGSEHKRLVLEISRNGSTPLLLTPQGGE